MSAETNMYGMYPEEWGSMYDNRAQTDRAEHRAPFHGGLGHPTDYGVDAMPVSDAPLRPLSAKVAAMALDAQMSVER